MLSYRYYLRKQHIVLICALCFVCIACRNAPAVKARIKSSGNPLQASAEVSYLLSILEKADTNDITRYAILNRMMSYHLEKGEWDDVVLFLTRYAARHPADPYNSYWLLMAAYAYLKQDAAPFAEYYFDRILRTYSDLLVKGESIHYICLKNLVQISHTPHNRIRYFNDLISRFSDLANVTELYYRLALEYEKDNEWENALASFRQFLSRPDASTIQIAGEPNAFAEAHRLVDFYNSPRDWTFSTLDELESAVKNAISAYDWRALDRLRTRVNFFSVAWKSDNDATPAQESFSMRSYMRGQRISFASHTESGDTRDEVYLRTWGWSQYVSTWYLYFRRVNFPIDPDIHGNWEWAGIYIGEKM